MTLELSELIGVVARGALVTVANNQSDPILPMPMVSVLAVEAEADLRYHRPKANSLD